ncbi:MAG: 6-hydroxymethylpterin diphosphokinase MptE-like protein [Spirochaetota bacterium]|nr:6-hydroxymethylpterin diphosphokinase MptE-like protein [Spirochaetota bacterium]
MDKSILFKELNEGIIQERFFAFKRNLCKNIKYIERYGGLSRVIPLFDSKSVIIVGAGSSLKRELDILKRYCNRREIAIISTDMALAPLYKNGILPKFVISCETTPVDFFRDISTDNMHLLAFSCLSNVNLRKWKGDISFYNWMIHNPLYDKLWETAGLDLGFVATGGIVTTQAVSLALSCNIQSLMLIGNDLGFRREYYIKESVVFNNNLSLSNRLDTMETMDMKMIRKSRQYEINRGESVFYSNNQFLAAKFWLEELFSKTSIQVFDSSDPGCSEGSLKKVELRNFFGRFDRRAKKKRR